MTGLAPSPRPTRYAAAVGGLPRAFWWLWTGTLVNRLGMVVQPFLVLYLTTVRGLSAGTAGLIVALGGIGALLSQPAGGLLTDAIGRRRTMVAALLGNGAGLLALGAVRSLPAIALCAFLVGLIGDMYRPASAALVADVVPSADRPRAYGLQYWAVNLGFSVATLSAGLLVSRGYGLLFFVDAGTSAVFAFLVFRFIRDVPSADDTSPAQGGRRPGLRVALADHLLLALTGVSTISGLVYMQAYSTLPLAVVRAGLSASAYGLALAVNGVAIVALQPLLLPVISRRDRGTVLAIAQLLLCVGMASTALCSNVVEYGGSVLLWTLGEIGIGGLFTSLIADLAPPHLRGRYLGIFGITYGLSAALGPAVGTLVFQHLGATALWTGCAVAGVAATAAMLKLNGSVRARLASGGTERVCSEGRSA